MNIPFPDEIKKIINKRTNIDFNSEICKTCSASCCNGPGFAIFENTLKIYENIKTKIYYVKISFLKKI